jgi:hypothetical protein
MSEIILLDFAREFLNHCQEIKTWKKNIDDFRTTCSYTSLGIGLVIKLFEDNHIYNGATLDQFLLRTEYTIQNLCYLINETIGNFVDIIKDCPVTNAQYGMRGIISTEFKDDVTTPSDKIYTISPGCSNLVEGINIISFASRGYHRCDTFHHSTIYINHMEDTCYIIDSWSHAEACRPLSIREFPWDAGVMIALDRINSYNSGQDEYITILETYFGAPPQFRRDMEKLGIQSITAYTINMDYVISVYNTYEDLLQQHGKNEIESHFGGKRTKKRKRRGTRKGTGTRKRRGTRKGTGTRKFHKK